MPPRSERGGSTPPGGRVRGLPTGRGEAHRATADARAITAAERRARPARRPPARVPAARPTRAGAFRTAVHGSPRPRDPRGVEVVARAGHRAAAALPGLAAPALTPGS